MSDYPITVHVKLPDGLTMGVRGEVVDRDDDGLILHEPEPMDWADPNASTFDVQGDAVWLPIDNILAVDGDRHQLQQL